MLKRVIVLFLLTSLVNSCQTAVEEHLADDFGNSVRTNVAFQTLNEEPSEPGASKKLDGRRVEQAVDRMRSRNNQAETGSLIQGIGN